jgi:hypothetical protein
LATDTLPPFLLLKDLAQAPQRKNSYTFVVKKPPPFCYYVFHLVLSAVGLFTCSCIAAYLPSWLAVPWENEKITS